MTDAAAFDRMGPAVGDARAEARVRQDRAFDDARRHTRRVQWLRKAIPIACLAAVFLAIFGRFLNPFRVIDADVSVSSIALQGTKVTMEQPKLSGFKKDNKAYEVVAEAASQDIRKPSIVELTLPVARIEMQKGSWVRLTAARGVYDSTTEKLVVNEAVTVKTDSGLHMRLKRADVDFKAGTMLTSDPAEVDLPNGWVKSDTMKVLDNGKVILFEGNVRSEFTPPPEDAAAKGDASAGSESGKALSQ